MAGKHSLHLVYWRRHAHRDTNRNIGRDWGTHILAGKVCIKEVGEEKVGPYPGGKSIVLVACERPVELILEDDILKEAAIRVKS